MVPIGRFELAAEPTPEALLRLLGRLANDESCFKSDDYIVQGAIES
jgi:hypothetical protein